jgi:hypothetical protein
VRVHYSTVPKPKREPSEGLLNAPGLLVNKAGCGSETHLVVKRRPPCRDSDPAWQRLLAYVREHGLVLLEDQPYRHDHAPQNRIYVTPEARRWFYGNPGELSTVQQQLEAMRRHGDFR